MIRKFFLFIFLLTMMTSPAAVQAQTGEIWSPSVNISQSGASFSPSFVVDSQGVIHVFWADEFADLMYARSEGGIWSSPQQVILPFDTYVPRLVLGANDQIHAFWINDDGDLFYSRAASGNLGNAGAWNGATLLADSAIFFDAAVASNGIVHLAYIRSEESETGPSGVYYRGTNSSATAWQTPAIIYLSRYFRSLDSNTANVQVAVSSNAGGSQVYLVWDNQPLKTVFFARSLNGGENWDQPAEIASPLTRASATIPYNIQVATLKDQIVLVYQDGQPGLSCSQSYHYSYDLGATWSGPERMIEDVPGCALENTFTNLKDEYLVLMTGNRDQVVLTAWDGSRWSESRQQSEMIQVNDTATRSILTLSCQRIQIDTNDELNLVGCDLEREDIWWKKRVLNDISNWFQQDSAWRAFETITIGEYDYPSLTLAADASNQVHGFWNRASGDILSLPAAAIFYSRWEGQQFWANPVTVQTANQQFADQLSAKYDPANNNLYLVWKEGLSGAIMFSWAPANQAILASAWSTPLRISLDAQASDSPAIVIDPGGRLLVVYAAPINEGRGIYLAASSDGGITWAGPTRILDAAALGFDMINRPHLDISAENQYHLIWTRYQFTAAQPQPVELYYARSFDGGNSWSDISQVTGLPVFWSHLETVAPQIIHRFWQELDGSQVDAWHEVSLDNGQTWQKGRPSSLFGERIGTPAISQDNSGRIHLLQLLRSSDGRVSLQHLVWENGWTIQQAKEINLEIGAEPGSPSVSISPQGFLGVVFPVEITNPVDERSEHRLLFTGQDLADLPPLETQVSAPTSDTPGLNQTPVVTPGLEPTPTETVARPISPNPAPAINPTIGILIGVFFSILVIAAVVAYRLWHKSNR